MRIYANIKLNIDAHSHPFVSILVDPSGLEPLTSAVQMQCSTC